MSIDDAKKAGSSTLLRAGFVSAAALAGEHATGSPLGAAAAGTIADTLVAFYQKLASGATDELNAWHAVHGLREDFTKLVSRVEKLESQLAEEGLKPDRFDPLSREQTFSQFAKDVSAARSIVKREALVNAAAGMHDPRIGGEATRAFWYGVLQRLPDLEIFVIQVVAQYEGIAFAGADVISFDDDPQVVDLRGEDFRTILYLVEDMANAQPLATRLLNRDRPGRSLHWKGSNVVSRIELTSGGRILAKLIAD